MQGSGWAVLGYDTVGGKLTTFQLYDQQGNMPAGLVPVLVLDVWEHAYYLQYKNVRADYVTAWWNVANWADAGARFDRARAAGGLIVPDVAPPRGSAEPTTMRTAVSIMRHGC